ncbi:DUF1801 domain-containing protein [Fulvivirgaceae bacterium BMA10]|uniref:DUF1801 domain-containing protein n=1 Tax=Splendidivirga corallicola TaxID=3051826 RepID=A0ABT8KVA5_9BACT|nr:DUF1801 domain-containing protein [Fulvivirgaceae bacterium BMA10]
MAELKTKLNDGNVEAFIDAVGDDKQRADCRVIMDIMKSLTNAEPKMWGNSIVGFGSYHYKYDSGREGDWFLTGFSPRKQNLTLYIMSGFSNYEELFTKLGKFKTGKSCLYVKKLEDIDLDILKEMIVKSIDTISKRYSK